MEPKEGLVRLSAMVLVLQGAGCAQNSASYTPCTGEMDQKLVVVEFFGEDGILPRNAFPLSMDVYSDATLSGVQRLDPAIELECPDPYRLGIPLQCSAGTVFSLTLGSRDVMRILTSMPADDLERIPTGTPVRFKVESNDSWFGKYGPGLNLIVEEAYGGKLLLAAMSWERLEYFPDHDFGPMIVSRDPDYVCTYKTYMDCKQYMVTALLIEAAAESYRLEPGESMVVPTHEGSYRISQVRGKDRTCFGEVCCMDVEWDHFSYTIVAVE
jgi:hypothetical protein